MFAFVSGLFSVKPDLGGQRILYLLVSEDWLKLTWTASLTLTFGNNLRQGIVCNVAEMAITRPESNYLAFTVKMLHSSAVPHYCRVKGVFYILILRETN